MAKYRSLIPSLALLIHLADAGQGPVTLDSLEMAIGWGEYLESHAERIYSMAIRGDVLAARCLAKKLLDGSLQNGFTARDVYRPCWSGLASKEEAQEAIELLIDLDWLRVESKPTSGKSKAVHQINPGIFSLPPSDTTDKTDKSPSDSAVSSSSGGEDELSDDSGDERGWL